MQSVIDYASNMHQINVEIPKVYQRCNGKNTVYRLNVCGHVNY